MEKKKKKRCIIGIILLVVLVIILLLCLRSCHNEPLPDDTEPTTEETKSLDFVPADSSQESITIPATTGLNMAAGQLKQSVDFYNPDENNCYFKISLYLSDDTQLYQSELIEPSEHILDITLNQELEKGIYQNCRLTYDCYTLDETMTPLNSGDVILEINAK